MTLEALLSVLGDALSLSLLLAAPVLGASALSGVLSGLFQGATQVQDSSLSFVPKLLLVALVLALLGPLGVTQLSEFTRTLWQQLPALAR